MSYEEFELLHTDDHGDNFYTRKGRGAQLREITTQAREPMLDALKIIEENPEAAEVIKILIAGVTAYRPQMVAEAETRYNKLPSKGVETLVIEDQPDSPNFGKTNPVGVVYSTDLDMPGVLPRRKIIPMSMTRTISKEPSTLELIQSL